MCLSCRGQYISFAEATAILKNELKFPEDRAIHFVKRFDHNKDGRLSAGEFTQFKKRIEDTYDFLYIIQWRGWERSPTPSPAVFNLVYRLPNENVQNCDKNIHQT